MEEEGEDQGEQGWKDGYVVEGGGKDIRKEGWLESQNGWIEN